MAERKREFMDCHEILRDRHFTDNDLLSTKHQLLRTKVQFMDNLIISDQFQNKEYRFPIITVKRVWS